MLDDAPLFGGYLFAELLDREIIERSRCMSLPQFNEVPEALIDRFRSTEWQRSEDCATGSTVRIKDGPFNHMQAIVKAKKGDRIIVLMNILNGEQELSLALKDVEAA